MNSNVRLGVEAVLVIVLIIALFLYFSQQQELTDTQVLQTNAEATAAAFSSDFNEQGTQIAELEAAQAEAQTVSDEQVNMAATAMADVSALSTQLAEAQAAADAASTAQAAAEAASLEQANAAATALADAGAAQAQVAEVQAAADTAATAQAEAQAAAEESAQQVADLQATIEALNAVTPEPEVEATEEPTAEAQEATEEAVEATEEATAEPEATADVMGFPADVFALTVGEDYTVYNLTGEEREASLAAIAAVDADLAARLGRETSYDYAAVSGAGEYILINQQDAPAGVSTVADVADVAFRRANSSEQLTLGANEVGRGMFGENEVRYIVIDGGSLWVLTFVSADVAGNLAAFDEIVATFDAVEPPAEEESGD